MVFLPFVAFLRDFGLDFGCLEALTLSEAPIEMPTMSTMSGGVDLYDEADDVSVASGTAINSSRGGGGSEERIMGLSSSRGEDAV